VGEEFITDSIQFGRLVDGRRAYYRVIGAPDTDVVKKGAPSPIVTADVRETTAVVKKRRKEILTPSPRRPLSMSPENKEAEVESDPLIATLDQAGPIERGNSPGEYVDALSEAMKEIKAVQHLVGTATLH
jgi:hypothetical protein